jgi:hypothetical protein
MNLPTRPLRESHPVRRAALPTLALVAAFTLGGSALSPAQAPEPPDAQIAEGAKRIAENVTEAERQRLAAVEAVAPLVRPSLSAPSPVATDGDGEDAAEPPPLVSLDGPTKVPSGGFDVLVTAPKEAALHWDNDVPEGAGQPRRMRDEDGNLLLVYFNPLPGTYTFRVMAQVPVDGLDPVGTARLVVVVGGKPPEKDSDGDGKPDSIDPCPFDPLDKCDDPAPGPDLTGLAKAVYEAAKGVDKAALRQAAGAYGSQVSAINAGAYNAVPLASAKDQIVAALQEQNPPRNVSPALFDLIDGELQRLDEGGRLPNLASISAALADVEKGLEAAAR